MASTPGSPRSRPAARPIDTGRTDERQRGRPRGLPRFRAWRLFPILVTRRWQELVQVEGTPLFTWAGHVQQQRDPVAWTLKVTDANAVHSGLQRDAAGAFRGGVETVIVDDRLA